MVLISIWPRPTYTTNVPAFVHLIMLIALASATLETRYHALLIIALFPWCDFPLSLWNFWDYFRFLFHKVKTYFFKYDVTRIFKKNSFWERTWIDFTFSSQNFLFEGHRFFQKGFLLWHIEKSILKNCSFYSVIKYT